MLGDYMIGDQNHFLNDSIVQLILQNRHEHFMKWIAIEVISKISSEYQLTSSKNWSIGGFSNGGYLVLDLSVRYPNIFGHVISMSAASFSKPINFIPSNTHYYLCAGINEPTFFKNSLAIAKALKDKNIPFQHQRYNTGHDYLMWHNFYIKTLLKLYH